MPEPTTEETPKPLGTEGSEGAPDGDKTPDPNADINARLDIQAEAIKLLGREGAQRVAAGESIEDVSLDYQSKVNLTAEDITKAINDGIAAGDGGSAVLSGVRDVMGLMHTDQLNREGKRELENLAIDPELAHPFKRYRTAFAHYLKDTGVTYVQLSNPGAARRAFRIFLSENTEYQEIREKEQREKIRAEEAEKLRKEQELREPVRPGRTPTLGDRGSRPEGGGVLRRLVDSAVGASDVPTQDQADIMSEFGFDEEKSKAAMQRHSKKTAMGTPLDYVPTRNEGAVD